MRCSRSVIPQGVTTTDTLTQRSPLRACDFPTGTPLSVFFAWNEARRRRDRRYTIACDLWSLYRRFDADGNAATICVCHLAIRPVIRWRSHSYIFLSSAALSKARALSPDLSEAPIVAAADRLVRSLFSSITAIEADTHAAVFKAFEELSRFVDLRALAARRPRRVTSSQLPIRRKILVIKLSALGDFIQALGPAAAIRRHHAGDEITLLTTDAFAELARQSGLFDKLVIDGRPTLLDVSGWLALRRALRGGRFDRVYDLQTSDRSSFYAWLFLPARPPEWSGIAWHCSHPHANLGRHPQHTIDKQAEQLLMAGIYPTPLPSCRASSQPLPAGLAQRAFFLLIPGSSARHPEKRWPAKRYGELARRLFEATPILPVIVGARDEELLAAAIRAACPEAVDLVGRTSLTGLADLANAALFTIGNDTGATHIAAAGGHPVVVLFSGASDPSRCAPRGREVHVLASPSLDELSVDLVFAQAVKAADHSTPLQFVGASSTTGRARG
jgi:ADP-heptose:LPS heptosyltransferase